MTFWNDAVKFAADYIHELGITKRDAEKYGGLVNAVSELSEDMSDLSIQIFDEIADNVEISDAEAKEFLKNEEITELITVFKEYADLQGWDNSFEFAENIDGMKSVDEFISVAKSDSDLWDEIKMFVVDSIVGDIGFGYHMLDDPEFWDDVEKKL